MVSEARFDSIFDYSSAFKYQTITPPRRFNSNKYKSVFSYHSDNIEKDEETDHFQDENWVSLILRKAITLLLYIMVIASFPLSFWICVKKVHALERIVLMRLGKLQPIREPGFTLVLPLIDIWTRVDLRPQTFKLEKSQLLTADGGIVEVQSEVEYQVCNTVDYVTRLRRQQVALSDLGLCCLTNLVSEKDQEDLEKDRESLCHTLKHELNQVCLKWGFEVLDVFLSPVRVLKAAEPLNPLGTIVTALKAATGQASGAATAVFPLLLGDNVSKDKPPLEEERSALDILKSVLSAAEVAKDVNGRFKLDVVGDDTKTVYCCFENGSVSIEKESVDPPDVSLSMSEEHVQDFLDKKMSPLQAYMDGKVTVQGDWKLLKPLAQVMRQ